MYYENREGTETSIVDNVSLVNILSKLSLANDFFVLCHQNQCYTDYKKLMSNIDIVQPLNHD